jgi:lipopolysaccharide assembly outer membrane protein LptD (OstA)
MRSGRTLILAAVAVAACAGIRAQQTQPAKAADHAAAQKQLEDVFGRADVMKTQWSDDTTHMLMKGNVKFTYKDTTMTCDEATYTDDTKTKTALIPGKINITSPDCDITGDKGSADFNKRLAIIEGNVTMLVKPKKSEETTNADSIKAKLKQPTTVTCPRLEYLYKDKIATLTGGITFKQEKRSGSADKAVYDANKELLTLTGDVKAVDEAGQTFAAPTVRISLKKGDEWMEAENASASFKVETGEEKAK